MFNVIFNVMQMLNVMSDVPCVYLFDKDPNHKVKLNSLRHKRV